MARDWAYHIAEQKIEEAKRTGATVLDLSVAWSAPEGTPKLTELPESIGQLSQLKELSLYNNKLTALPESIGQLSQLKELYLDNNQLTALPESIGQLSQLKELSLSGNQLTALPEFLGQLSQLQRLSLSGNQLTALPEFLGQLSQLKELSLSGNQLTALPESLGQLSQLQILYLNNNPLNPELAAAYEQGLDAVKAYLRAKAADKITLNEAKLILVGEGEVGKTCLMDALLGKPWEEHPSTHGIAINPITVRVPNSDKEITLNGWDFGGQRVYRPTHQLFFSAPAVYLVVWKPREGTQQGLVKDWIRLVKHREPDAKILVVATHGGPQQRQPDIDRQELWDLFGKETVLDFFFVESKPDENGKRRGIDELKNAIARVASELPEMGRSVPKSFQQAREALKETKAAYLPFNRVLEICREQKMDEELAKLFVSISHRLGHLIHYEHDPALHDIVVLKPDWLATAISYVLDDEETRNAHGLVSFARLGQLWHDPKRDEESRYPTDLHPVFLRLMERFDLSYRVAELHQKNHSIETSLIGQLVPDNRPDPMNGWVDYPMDGNLQQVQICRIVDEKGQSATAEGLFYQLIVRLHKYSLGRVNYCESVHWQRGLVLDDDYNGRALLEHKENDVHITVRAPYPERFLAMLTSEVKYLVERFWEGLQCNVMVPCLNPKPCIGQYEVKKLIENKQRGRPEQPCPVCNEWQEIDALLRNAPAATPPPSLDKLLAEFAKIEGKLNDVDVNTRRILSRVDETYTNLLQVLTDEAKEGPRLFSLVPVERSRFNPKEWTSTKFELTLWCEHSRLPLPVLNARGCTEGVYEIVLNHDWFKKAAPYLKFMAGTLSLVLPVASSGIKVFDETLLKGFEKELDFGKDMANSMLSGSEKALDFMQSEDKANLGYGDGIRAQGAILRELHAILKEKDPSFGGLVRVLNKRNEFLWVHKQFEGEY